MAGIHVHRDGPGIYGIEYDPASKVLIVEFDKGKRMAHHDVPEVSALGLLRASNPKAHLIRHVRGKYRTERLLDAAVGSEKTAPEGAPAAPPRKPLVLVWQESVTEP